jgi:hypothetical protein
MVKVKWRNNQYPAPILEEIDHTRFSRNENGSISYRIKGFADLDTAASTLLTFLDITGSTAGVDEQNRTIVDSIMQVGVCNKLKPRSFLDVLQNKLSELEQRPTNDYRVIGYISLSSNLKLTTRRIDGVRISLGANIGRFAAARKDIASGDQILSDTPRSYTPFKVLLNGRSRQEALSRSSKALAFLLGCWNHALTYGRARYSMGGRPGPIADIVLAPLRSLHSPSGDSLGLWMYDSDFVKYPSPFYDKTKWGKLREAEKQIRAQLRGHPFHPLLYNAILAYHEACSTHSLDNAFMTLWTLLETLTGTHQGEKLISRTLFPVAEKHYERYKWILKHLHRYRNKNVHCGETRPDIQTLAYQLKGYVDILLHCWLFHFHLLSEKQEVFDLLDVSRDSKKLSRQLKVLRMAEKHFKKARR